MFAVNAAIKALIACSMMLRNGLYGGSFLSSELGPVLAGLLCENRDLVLSLSSHSTEKCHVKNESIGG